MAQRKLGTGRPRSQFSRGHFSRQRLFILARKFLRKKDESWVSLEKGITFKHEETIVRKAEDEQRK